MRTSVPRVRSVRMKAGGAAVTVLHNDEPARVRGWFDGDIEAVRRKRGPAMAGYAIIVWDQFGTCSTASLTGANSPLLSGAIPDYCRSVLQDHQTRWRVQDDMGLPVPDGA